MKLGKLLRADKEQTWMLRRASTLHNLLLYAHSLCFIDQTQTFIIGSISNVCRNIFYLCGVSVEKSEHKYRLWNKIELWLIPPKQPVDITVSRNDIEKSSSALHLEKDINY